MSPATKIDRAAAVRRALVELVAVRGFRGTSMAAVAERAGVATGTAYVHYASKDELIIAAYVEVKQQMDEAAIAAVDPADIARNRFLALWRAIHDHMTADPVRAQFLLQIGTSPYRDAAAAAVFANEDDPMLDFAAAEDFVRIVIDLPPMVLYDLGIRPAIATAAGGDELSNAQLSMLAHACWRAITRDASDG